MELTGTCIRESPLAPGRVRLVGTVAYDDRQTASEEEYWFDVPERYAPFLSSSGNPWLTALLPLAITLGQPLRLGLPVDRLLLDNARELQRIWKRWYPHLHLVEVEAPAANPTPAAGAGRNASFFSGGVDSWFTVLWHDAELNEPRRVAIDDLLCVWGFDIPIDHTDAFGRVRTQVQHVADQLGKELVEVATNLRETRWRKADWVRLAHGAALASVGLALEARYRKILVGSSSPYDDLHPSGSHLLTDLQFGTARTSFVHDGAAFDRVDKTERVAKSDLALGALRVCWKSKGHRNCGTCEKCWRTMLTLELFNALHRCSTFRQEDLKLKSIERIYVTPPLRSDYIPLAIRARRESRLDIATGIERALRRSARLGVWLRAAGALRRSRLLGRLAGPLERAILARCVT